MGAEVPAGCVERRQFAQELGCCCYPGAILHPAAAHGHALCAQAPGCPDLSALAVLLRPALVAVVVVLLQQLPVDHAHQGSPAPPPPPPLPYHHQYLSSGFRWGCCGYLVVLAPCLAPQPLPSSTSVRVPLPLPLLFPLPCDSDLVLMQAHVHRYFLANLSLRSPHPRHRPHHSAQFPLPLLFPWPPRPHAELCAAACRDEGKGRGHCWLRCPHPRLLHCAQGQSKNAQGQLRREGTLASAVVGGAARTGAGITGAGGGAGGGVEPVVVVVVVVQLLLYGCPLICWGQPRRCNEAAAPWCSGSTEQMGWHLQAHARLGQVLQGQGLGHGRQCSLPPLLPAQYLQPSLHAQIHAHRH
eukprot:1138228-Pelagomonas_calceolata.AAC.2